jgi:hypothetical protein
VPLAETKALIAEWVDQDDMPIEYKRRLLAAMRNEQVRTVQIIQQLTEDVEQTAERGDLEQAKLKRTVLVRLLSHDAEFRILTERLAAEIHETVSGATASDQPATMASPSYFRQLS